MSKNKQIYTSVGFMSGTSMDGIDVAVIKTDGEQVLEKGPYHHVSYDELFVQALRSCLNTKHHDTPAVRMVEAKLTAYHVQAFNELLEKYDIERSSIDCVGFHGHTIDHRPDEGITLQIGDGNLLAKHIGVPVVYNFRVADVKAGGQGAPLVPIYHRALMQNKKTKGAVALLNIGGVANITYLPSLDDKEGEIIAFDTGPGNALINDLVKYEIAQPFDKDGKIARSGRIDQNWVEEFLTHAYFEKPYPKSLDRNDFQDIQLPKELKFEDKVATMSEATVASVVKAIEILPSDIEALYLCGGGRLNKFFINRLREHLDVEILDTDMIGLNGDMIEAEAFGFFAVRYLQNKPITFPLTTGTKKPPICGEFATPETKQDKNTLDNDKITA